MLIEIVFVFVFLLCNGFFVLLEMVLVVLCKSCFKYLVDCSWCVCVVLVQVEVFECFLFIVQVGIIIVMLFIGVLVGDVLGDYIVDVLYCGWVVWLELYVYVLGFVLGFVVILFIQIVFGELVFKCFVLVVLEIVLMVVGLLMLVLLWICVLFVWLFNVCSLLVFKLLCVIDCGISVVIEEEICLLVVESVEQGVLDVDEYNMVNCVLCLGDCLVDSVMILCMCIVWLDIVVLLVENLEVLCEMLYLCYLVYCVDESDIVGVVEVKSLLVDLGQGVFDLFWYLFKLLYVLVIGCVLDLLEEFCDVEMLMVLVVDEYGDIEGVVIINDLFLVVVGVVQFGYGSVGEEYLLIVKCVDGSWLVDGMLFIDDLCELLCVGELLGEDEYDFCIVVGMVMIVLGYIFQVGEVFVWCGVCFEVVDLDGVCIDKLLVMCMVVVDSVDDEVMWGG